MPVMPRIAAHGYEADTNSPRGFAAFIQSGMIKWGRNVKAAGIRAD